jgi:hypothetical protein
MCCQSAKRVQEAGMGGHEVSMRPPFSIRSAVFFSYDHLSALETDTVLNKVGDIPVAI